MQLKMDDEFQVLLTFVNNSSEMIRANHHEGGRVVCIQCRNGFYQGEFKHSHFSGNGLVYFQEEKHLIACKHFELSCINGPSFFVYDRHHYHFGEYQSNSPIGPCVFRIKDAVIVAEYTQGGLVEGSNAFILVESYNVCVIAEVRNEGNWVIRQKRQVYCLQHIQSVLGKCTFSRQVELSLFKFISHFLNESPFQLRLINNDYYRFGFEEGLSISFDQAEHILHINADQCKQIVERSVVMSPIRAGQVYKSSELARESYFKNKGLKDPSKGHYRLFAKIMDQIMLKAILSGFIMNSSLNLTRHQDSEDYQSSFKQSNTDSECKQLILNAPNKQKEQDFSKMNSIQERRNTINKESQVQKINFSQQNHSKLALKIERLDERRTSKILRQPIKLFSFRQSPTKKQMASKEAQIEAAIQDDHQEQPTEECPIYKPAGMVNQASPIRKSKRRIFQNSPEKKETIFKKSNQEIQNSQNKLKQSISIHNQSKVQSSKQYANSENNNVKHRHRPSSPIFDLKSDALKTQKSKDTLIQREIPHSNTNNRSQSIKSQKILLEKQGQNERSIKKRAMTEFQIQSNIYSEGMSNLFDLGAKGNIQMNETASKKLKKHNEIYLQGPKQEQKSITRSKQNDNSPYLAASTKIQFTRSTAVVIPKRERSTQKKYRYL